MKLGSMVLCLLSAAVGSMGVVEGASLVYDANINKLDAEPTCSLHYGLARVDETVSNIAHLSDVANFTCSVPAATCARVSHEGSSSIFFCNFESHNIETRCENLIESAKKVCNTCRMGDRYTYGYVSRSLVDGSQSYPYLVAIGDDYAFEP
ncbi:hypothetical protein AFUB_048600 [Aspergillus fumigatus A1163]|uniref:Uncharacterized protein n=1 Tax=Aspergillus fumigatus (strain CBS 144.89 / FGSC A1163 / CEA10) TaxID=451804 RepID=B0XXR7_ASPFC|nr:hypothetical protein AFUB_048600 [Aspergillus fumigatus A1163]